MHTFLATLYVSPNRVEEFEKYSKELAVLTREHEPDTLVYELIKSVENPLEYKWYARFKDVAAFEYHQQTEFHDRLIPLILDCLSEEMQLEFPEFIC